MSAFPDFSRRCRVLALLAIAVVAHAVTMEPAPATILTAEKPIENAWVEIETTDGVSFFLGDPKSQTRVAGNKKTGQYQKVVYQSLTNGDISFQRAEVHFTNSDFATASEQYKKATTTSKWNWEVEQAYRRAAACLVPSKLLRDRHASHFQWCYMSGLIVDPLSRIARPQVQAWARVPPHPQVGVVAIHLDRHLRQDYWRNTDSSC